MVEDVGVGCRDGVKRLVLFWVIEGNSCFLMLSQFVCFLGIDVMKDEGWICGDLVGYGGGEYVGGVVDELGVLVVVVDDNFGVGVLVGGL